jgi:hypothetical protein
MLQPEPDESGAPAVSPVWETGGVTDTEQWDLWVDFHRVDADGLTHASVKDAAPGVRVEPGRYLVVGDYDADPAVAQVIEVKANGVVLLRVLPGHARLHQALHEPKASGI